MNSPTTPLDPVADADPRYAPNPLAPPEWLLLVVRSVEDGRYLLVRRPGNRALTMLSTAPPHRTEGFANGIGSLVRTHLRVAMRGAPRVSAVQRPVHTVHPFTGGQGPGYLRALAVEVAGDPKTDALFEGMQALRLEDAIEALSTDLERLVFQDGAKLLGDTVPAGWTASRRPTSPVSVAHEDEDELEVGDDGELPVAQIDDEPEEFDDTVDLDATDDSDDDESTGSEDSDDAYDDDDDDEYDEEDDED